MNDFAAKHLVDRMCEAGHVAYEAKAQEVGWSTQPMSRVPWALVPHENQLAMKASMAAALAMVYKELDDVEIPDGHETAWNDGYDYAYIEALRLLDGR